MRGDSPSLGQGNTHTHTPPTPLSPTDCQSPSSDSMSPELGKRGLSHFSHRQCGLSIIDSYLRWHRRSLVGKAWALGCPRGSRSQLDTFLLWQWLGTGSWYWYSCPSQRGEQSTPLTHSTSLGGNGRHCSEGIKTSLNWFHAPSSQ